MMPKKNRSVMPMLPTIAKSINRFRRYHYILGLLIVFLWLDRGDAMAQQETGVDKSPTVTCLTGTGLATDSNRAQDYTGDIWYACY